MMGEMKKGGNRWQMLTSNSVVIISGACSAANLSISYLFWAPIKHIFIFYADFTFALLKGLCFLYS